jgi:pimeloyl-ACP methyl ester carboxylesterase
MDADGKHPMSSRFWTTCASTKPGFWGHSMGGDVALTLGRHHPDRVRVLIVTDYSPFAAEGDELAEMTAWAADLKGGMAEYVAGYERRHGALHDDARARWLENDGAALAACVASMLAESDGSQVADLPGIAAPAMFLAGTREPFVDQAREAAGLLPHGTFVPLAGLDHVQTFFRGDLVLPHVRAFLDGDGA